MFKKNYALKRGISILTLGAMLFSGIVGCGSNGDGNIQADKPAEDNTPVEITIFKTDNPSIETTWASVKDSPVVKQIEEKCNVKLNMVGGDHDKLQVMMASGEIPGDIIFVTSKEDVQNLIKGQHIVPLDDLVANNAPDIQNVESRIQISKDYYSNGTGQLYTLPSNVGLEGHEYMIYHSIYRVRWDWYKELGYPEIKNTDDLVEVLSQMQQNHPTTDDGKPVYAVSCNSDGFGYYCWSAYASTYGIGESGNVLFDTHDESDIYPKFSEDSPYWDAMEYYYKINQAGLFDPDAFTQTYDDFAAKVNAGQVMAPEASWLVLPFNQAEYAKDNTSIAGILAIPVEGTTVHTNVDLKFGFDAQLMCINKKSENPEKAMEVLNYMFSYEGSRLIKSGVKGEHWDIVDGVAQYTPEMSELLKKGGDELQNTGVNFFEHFAGYSHGVIDPEDGEPMQLQQGQVALKAQNLPVDDDFNAYYNCEYPYQAFENKINEGTIQDFSDYNYEWRMVIDIVPDDIKMIDAKIDDIVNKAAPKLVLAKDDAEFDSVKAQMIEDIYNAGYETSLDWWIPALQKSFEEIEKY